MGKKRRDEEAAAGTDVEQKKKKKKGVEKAEAAAPAEPPSSTAARTTQPEGEGDGGRKREGGERGFQQAEAGEGKQSLVNPATAAYLTEVLQHFKTLAEPEEKELLIENVLKELIGKEEEVSTDPVCSRQVEALLGAAQPKQLTQFMMSIVDAGSLQAMVTR